MKKIKLKFLYHQYMIYLGLVKLFNRLAIHFVGLCKENVMKQAKITGYPLTEESLNF